MTQAFWLAALKTDGPITGNITGSCHIDVIFASSEYGYHVKRRIVRSISNKLV